jgi:hypothetical protein
MIYKITLKSKYNKTMRENLMSKPETVIFYFEKKALNLFSLKPHIFFILGPFWVI